MGIVLIIFAVLIIVFALYFIFKYAVKSAILEVRKEEKKLDDIDI